MLDTSIVESFHKTTFTPHEFDSDIHHQLYDHWQEIRNGNPLPLKKDFKPSAIVRALPFLLMLDVQRNPLRFKFRLTGTETVRVLGLDVKDCWIDEFPHTDQVIDRYTNLVEKMKPYFARDILHWVDKDFLYYTALTVPLSNDGLKVDYMVTTNHYIRT